MRHAEDGQRLDTEQNDRDEGDDDRQNGDDERRSRRLRVLEQHPQPAHRYVRRQVNHLRRVALGSLVLVT